LRQASTSVTFKSDSADEDEKKRRDGRHVAASDFTDGCADWLRVQFI